MLPKKTAYVKGYDGKTKWFYFLIEKNHILTDLYSKNNIIWNKVSVDTKK